LNGALVDKAEFVAHLKQQVEERGSRKKELREELHSTKNYTKLVSTELNPGTLKTGYSSWACGQLRAPLATTAQASFA
jgi:putative AlgH/UPF0301 family transcriptional regulator